MRRKQQIQAMQQELTLLRQTIDSGKEQAALATGAAQQLKKPSIKAIAVQVMKTPRFRRAALIVGGAAAVGTIGAIAARYRFYQTIVAQEVKKGAQACARPARRPAGNRGRHGRGRGHRSGKGPQGEKAPPLKRGGRNTKKSSVSRPETELFVVIVLGSTAGRDLRVADFRAWSARS